MSSEITKIPQVPNEVLGSTSEPKLFGRYHELGLLLIGFLLTTVVGTVLTYFYQQRAWTQDHKARQHDQRVVAASQAFDEVSKLLDRRLYRARTLAWAYMGEEEGETIQIRRAEYRVTVDEWNGALNRNLVLLERNFGREIKFDFEMKLSEQFRAVHKDLNSYRKQSDSQLLSSIEVKLDRLNVDIYQFNLVLLDCIQRGAVGGVGCR